MFPVASRSWRTCPPLCAQFFGKSRPRSGHSKVVGKKCSDEQKASLKNLTANKAGRTVGLADRVICKGHLAPQYFPFFFANPTQKERIFPNEGKRHILSWRYSALKDQWTPKSTKTTIELYSLLTNLSVRTGSTNSISTSSRSTFDSPTNSTSEHIAICFGLLKNEICKFLKI